MKPEKLKTTEMLVIGSLKYIFIPAILLTFVLSLGALVFLIFEILTGGL